MGIEAGDLNQRIQILQPLTQSRQMGESIVAYTLIREVWAKAIEAMGKEFISGGQVNSQRKVAFKLHWAADLAAAAASLRVIWAATNFEVTASTGTHASGELWLHCQSLGA